MYKPLLPIGIFSRSDLGSSVLMASTSAESERIFCWTRSPRSYTHYKYTSSHSLYFSTLLKVCSSNSGQIINLLSREKMIVIEPENCKISKQKLSLKLGLQALYRSHLRRFIVNEMITDYSFDVCVCPCSLLSKQEFQRKGGVVIVKQAGRSRPAVWRTRSAT